MNATTPGILLRALTAILSTRLLAIRACIALAALSRPASAAPDDLDPTFGTGGKVTGNFGAEAKSMAIQPDGKILVPSDFGWLRLNTDGTWDASSVRPPIDFSAASVAVQGDGKIVVAGSFANSVHRSDIAVARYNANGSLDTSFGGTGEVMADFSSQGDYAQSVAIQSDGKIVVAGYSYDFLGRNGGFVLLRYNSDGSLDTSFGGTGKVLTPSREYTNDHGRSMALQTDGKILVAGDTAGSNDDFAVFRYNANGSLDASFGNAGRVSTDFGDRDIAYSVALQSDGRIIVAGVTSVASGGSNISVVRFTDTGSLDASFNGTGKVTTSINPTDAAYGVALQQDGRIVVAGETAVSFNYDFALVRYNVDGSLDARFGNAGTVTTQIGSGDDRGRSVLIQNDWKIVVQGSSGIARYVGDVDTDGDGLTDHAETGTGIYVSPEDTGTSPTNSDSDGDGLSDGQEVSIYLSNPNVRDTDGDGFDDGFEVSTGFSPTSATSTPDALSTALPAIEYRFNAASGVSYRIEASTDLANWATIETPIIGAGGVITRFYSTEGQPRRFFRSRRN